MPALLFKASLQRYKKIRPHRDLFMIQSNLKQPRIISAKKGQNA
jgi:hypothetical protein